MNWNEIYELPLHDSYIDGDFRSGRIYDSEGNFVFQFVSVDNESQRKILNILNGKNEFKKADVEFTHHDGYVFAGQNKIMMIRGWGNLTGTGGHNLHPDDAAIVQDTFADFIVEKLTKSKTT